jgi:hypothetical protein
MWKWDLGGAEKRSKISKEKGRKDPKKNGRKYLKKNGRKDRKKNGRKYSKKYIMYTKSNKSKMSFPYLYYRK